MHPAPSPLPKEHYVDSWVCSTAIGFLDRHREQHPDTPFFLFASFPKPHAPYDPPRPFDTLYDPRDVPAPLVQADDLKRTPTKFQERITRGWNLVSPEAMQVARAYYFGQVSLQDKQIGRILDYLDRWDLADNTIVIYTSDHGDLMGDFGFFAKYCFYSGSVRIPMIVKIRSEPGKGGGPMLLWGCRISCRPWHRWQD